MRRGLLVLVAVLSAGLAQAITFDPAKMMRASEVRRGMIGECWTVFHGVEISKFKVEILGVLPGNIVTEPMIVFRAIEGPLVERNCPVAGGMSGSPVFVDGRLIGAVAYTFHFEKEPAGGITPIEAMIRGTGGKVSFVPQPVRIGGRTYTAWAPGPSEDPHTLAASPALSPIYVTTASPRAMKLVEKIIGSLGFDALPGAGRREPVPVEFGPGAGCGLQLCGGDVSVYTFGTVTWREGDEILAFGHPFMQQGELSIPMTTVYITDVIPNYKRSDKMGSLMDVIGAILRDSPWAIAGRVGAKAPTIPAVVRVVDETRDRSRTFSLVLCRNRRWTAAGALAAALECMDWAYHGTGRPGVAEVSYTIRGEKGAVLRRTDIFASESDPAAEVGAELDAALRSFLYNRFEPQNIRELRVDVHLRAERRLAYLQRVWVDEPYARAGEEVTLHLELKPVGEKPVVRTVKIKMPWELPKSSVNIAAGGGEAALSLREQLGLFVPDFKSFDAMLRFAEALERNNELVVLVSLPRTGLAVDETALPHLPQSVADLLKRVPRSGVRQIRDYEVVRIKVPWVVRGTATVSLGTVTRRGERGRPAPPRQQREQRTWAGCKLEPIVQAIVAPNAPPPMLASASTLVRLPRPAAGQQRQAQKAEKKPGRDAGKVQAKQGVWRLAGLDAMLKGELRGLAVTGDGLLEPAIYLKPDAAAAPGGIVWAAARVGKRIVASCGVAGAMYVLEGGGWKKLCQLPEGLFTKAIARFGNGLAVAPVPGGRVYRVGLDGSVVLLASIQAGYVWDLEPDGDGLLAATGWPAAIWRISSDGKVSHVATLPEDHVLDVLRDGKFIYAATGSRGAVYRLGRGTEQVLDTGQLDVTALARGPDGRIIAATAPKLQVWAVGDGRAELWLRNDSLRGLALVSLGKSVVVACGEPAIAVEVLGRDRWRVLLQDHRAASMSCAALAKPLTLFGVGPAKVWRETATKTVSYVTPVADAGKPVKWLAAMVATQPPSAKVKVRVRAGASPYYDAGTWSAWVEPGLRLGLPAARYAQVKVEAAAGQPLRIWAIALRYAAPNQRPKLQVEAPKGPAAVSGTVEIKWKAEDPDGDTVAIRIECAGQDGKWRTVAAHLAKSPYKWQTKKLKDGVYTLRIVASDRPSRPDGARERAVVLAPIVVDNTKPRLAVRPKLQRLPDGRLRARLVAEDAMSGVAVVSYRWPGTDLWYACRPIEGNWGERAVVCELVTDPWPEDAKALELRVRDRAGNYVDLKIPVPPAKPKKSK